VALWRLPRPDFHRLVNTDFSRRTTHVTAYMLAKSPPRPSTGGFSGFVASTAAPIATGWNEPVPGWDSHPLWSIRLRTAH